MEISVLQSLINRTSNQIAEYEYGLLAAKNCLKNYSVYEHEKAEDRSVISFYKQKLSKLREIQKALKKEIAKQIERQRSVEHFFKMYNAYPMECLVY